MVKVNRRDRRARFTILVYYGDLAKWRFRQFREPVWHEFVKEGCNEVNSMTFSRSDGDYCIQIAGSDSGFIVYNHGPDALVMNNTKYGVKDTMLLPGHSIRISDKRLNEYIDIAVF